jgi:hypothetical protein
MNTFYFDVFSFLQIWVDGENETDISKRSEEQKEEFDIDVIAC